MIDRSLPKEIEELWAIVRKREREKSKQVWTSAFDELITDLIKYINNPKQKINLDKLFTNIKDHVEGLSKREDEDLRHPMADTLLILLSQAQRSTKERGKKLILSDALNELEDMRYGHTRTGLEVLDERLEKQEALLREKTEENPQLDNFKNAVLNHEKTVDKIKNEIFEYEQRCIPLFKEIYVHMKGKPGEPDFLKDKEHLPANKLVPLIKMAADRDTTGRIAKAWELTRKYNYLRADYIQPNNKKHRSVFLCEEIKNWNKLLTWHGQLRAAFSSISLFRRKPTDVKSHQELKADNPQSTRRTSFNK